MSKSSLLIALRFAVYLIYLSSKIKPSNIYHRIQSVLGGFWYYQVNDFEKYSKLLVKAQLDLDFLRKCLLNNLKPKFLKFTTSIPNFNRSKSYKISQRKALIYEINSK